MTEVAFHFGASNKLAYACRLVRKATGTGVRVMLIANPDELTQIDAALWGVAATDFVTHARDDARPAMLARSSVLVGAVEFGGVAMPRILVNMADDVPQAFTDFDRVIEIVSTDDGDRDLARRRWMAYKQQGISITRHDLQLKPPVV
jgi:DNA polymerase-3 subunit chi